VRVICGSALDEIPGPVLVEGQIELLLAIDDDGAAPGNRFAKRLSAHQKEAKPCPNRSRPNHPTLSEEDHMLRGQGRSG